MSFNRLLLNAKETLAAVLSESPVQNFSAEHPKSILFFVASNGRERAHVEIATGASFEESWASGVAGLKSWRLKKGQTPVWLRVEAVHSIETLTWQNLKARLKRAKRNYFRFGLALTADFKTAMLEHELYANALLYKTDIGVATANAVNLKHYGKRRFGRELEWPGHGQDVIWRFKTRAVFTDGKETHVIEHDGRNSGYRLVEKWDTETVTDIIETSTEYLSKQVKNDGEYHYGWFPCFDRAIPTYNALRHASSTYALLEGWEVTQERKHKRAIDRALDFLTHQLIKTVELPDGTAAAFLVDLGDEIKLGGNAVCILAYAKYTEVTGDKQYITLMEQLAVGIVFMQKPDTGQYVHILNYPDLSVKAENRIIYYDGEAAFGLMRLYGITQDPRWLASVEKAFDYFIEQEHWKAHDHWLSYCVNELTLYNSDPKYYTFGLDNIRDHLDFVLTRITTYPTLLELMMAAQRMIERMQNDASVVHLLDNFDVDKFYRALEYRARYLLNGFFYPEVAMFFQNPARILGGFFIRHHTFRVRIDDVEHYLSGYVAYRKYLKRKKQVDAVKCEQDHLAVLSPVSLAKLTRGKWAVTPESTFKATGICIHKTLFEPGHLLVARGALGRGYLADTVIKELAADELSGIICTDPAPYLELGVPILQVKNIRAAVLALGAAARQAFSGMVIGVTGSAGKTTTVAMLVHALSHFGNTAGTKRSANLPVGIAWNQLNMPGNAESWVLEMAIGQMAVNANLVKPQVAIITNIAPAHLEYHQDTQTIAEKKALIMESISPSGTLVLFGDILHKDIFLDKAREKKLNVITYGEGIENDIRLIKRQGAVVQINWGQRSLYFNIGLKDKHMVLNALSVFAAMQALKIDWSKALNVFKTFNALTGRGEVHRVEFKRKNITIYDESYNANPLSMQAVIESAGAVEQGSSKFLILGDMLELGSKSIQYHRALLANLMLARPDKIILCGELMLHLWHDLTAADELAPVRKAWFSTVTEVVENIGEWLEEDDQVFIKASNSMGFQTLLNHLLGTTH
jgi:UDP-N-acetylmuramoyl-tripeptide--D-alanyl-D-alanine ligase